MDGETQSSVVLPAQKKKGKKYEKQCEVQKLDYSDEQPSIHLCNRET